MPALDWLRESFLQGAERLPGILAFRLTPFVGFVAVSHRFAWPAKVVVVVSYAFVAALATRAGSTPLAWLVLPYLYFAGAGWLVYEVSPTFRSRPAWFVLSLLLFWVLPVAAVRLVPRTFLIIGWELMLAAYSYQVDTARRQDRSLREFLFFLLVNPALVYRDRGARVTSPSSAKGFGRMVAGILVMLLSVGVFGPLYSRSLAAMERGASPGGLGAILLVGMLRLGKEYAAHSAAASMQISAMRQLGWSVPERYLYPLLARSPAEFWRRWNTYVGSWARIYVFVPLAFGLRRWARRAPLLGVAYAAALVLTFAAVGALHDLFLSTAEGRLDVRATTWFTANAGVVVVWELVAVRIRSRRTVARLGAWIQRALFLTVACYAAAYVWR
jgi:hypothetical protein